MQKLDIFKSRASASSCLWSKPRSKADKEAGKLSKTVQTYLKKTWLFNKYGYDEPVVTPQMMKGHLCETEAMRHLDRFIKSEDLRIKNEKNFQNDWFTGTMDNILITDKIVEDQKCPWSLRTYMDATINIDYITQGQVYMDLLRSNGIEVDTFRLNYVLCNTPTELLKDEKNRYFYKFGCNENNPQYIKVCNQLDRMHTYDDIPMDSRIKSFEVKFDPTFIEELRMNVENARPYYESITLLNSD